MEREIYGCRPLVVDRRREIFYGSIPDFYRDFPVLFSSFMKRVARARDRPDRPMPTYIYLVSVYVLGLEMAHELSESGHITSLSLARREKWETRRQFLYGDNVDERYHLSQLWQIVVLMLI